MKNKSAPIRFAFPRSSELKRTALSAAVALGLLAGAASSWAQQTPGNSIGIALDIAPQYAGARSYRILPLPDASFTETLGHSSASVFLQGLSAGIAYPITNQASAGLIMTFAPGRDQSDAAVLSGTGNIAASLEVGAFARWHNGPVGASLTFLQDTHAGYGNRLLLETHYLVLDRPADKVTVSMDGVWLDHAAMQTYFGIDGQQAADSTEHLSTYLPGSGWSQTDAKVSWRHALTPHWSIDSAIGLGLLIGNAGDSPVVERRASAFGSAGIAYRF